MPDAVSRLQLHVVFGLGQRIVRDGSEAVAEAVGAAEGAEHAGRRLGAREVGAENAGMRVRGAHHHRIGLTVEAGIIAEPPATRDQPLVFLSHEWPADEAEARRREFAVEVGHRRLHLASGCWWPTLGRKAHFFGQSANLNHMHDPSSARDTSGRLRATFLNSLECFTFLSLALFWQKCRRADARPVMTTGQGTSETCNLLSLRGGFVRPRHDSSAVPSAFLAAQPRRCESAKSRMTSFSSHETSRLPER